MDSSQIVSLTEQLTRLTDPRVDRTKRHKLLDVIAIAICAVICGADTWVDVELFGKSKKEWLRGFLALPNGIPSHDTFGRVFARLDAQQFEQCFIDWVRDVSELTEGGIVSIDGKTVRRSHDRSAGKAAIHMVSAWASANHLLLGQVKVDDRSNEITAIPELLSMLDVSGCIVTIDAMGCHKQIARTLTESGADYVLSLKDNQPRLHSDVKDTFAAASGLGFAGVEHDFHQRVEKGHGRIETRRCWSIADAEQIDWLNDRGEWSQLTSIAMVESERLIEGVRTKQKRYYISSLPAGAGRHLDAIRGHWGIENSLHWVLDVAFREDECRVRKGNGPENLSVLRRMALNLLKRETTSKGGIAAKRKRAGWDNEYLLKLDFVQSLGRV